MLILRSRLLGCNINISNLLLLLFSGDPPKQQVVEYTERSQDKHESRHDQMVRQYGFNPRSKVSVEDGSMLPRKFEPFPADMYGKPLEEIDNFIYEEVSGWACTQGISPESGELGRLNNLSSYPPPPKITTIKYFLILGLLWISMYHTSSVLDVG